jgi:Ca-activated chloride channel family protein
MIGCAAVLFSVGALLGPRFGASTERTDPRGADVVIALDVSRSMLARDVPPTRLAQARRLVRALAERARGDRLGLILFRSAAAAPTSGPPSTARWRHSTPAPGTTDRSSC